MEFRVFDAHRATTPVRRSAASSPGCRPAPRGPPASPRSGFIATLGVLSKSDKPPKVAITERSATHRPRVPRPLACGGLTPSFQHHRVAGEKKRAGISSMGVGEGVGSLRLAAYPRRSSPCRTLRRPRQRPRANRPTKFPRRPNRRSLNPSHPKPFENQELRAPSSAPSWTRAPTRWSPTMRRKGRSPWFPRPSPRRFSRSWWRCARCSPRRNGGSPEQELERFDALEQRFDALERRFDALEQRFDAQERKLDALTAEVQRVNEVVDVKLDGIRREMRLIWGALGISLTVWLVVLGYLLTN